jgi:hypothetical protein
MSSIPSARPGGGSGSSKKLPSKYAEFLTVRGLILQALQDIEDSSAEEKLKHAWLQNVLLRCSLELDDGKTRPITTSAQKSSHPDEI